MDGPPYVSRTSTSEGHWHERLSYVLDRMCEGLREISPDLARPQKPVAVNLISLLSSIAMAVGLAASLPQILRMLRTRSSGGQSVVGWGMGLITNLSMAYVNLFGFGAAELMASNLVSAALCVAAMLLIVRFNGAPVDDLAQTELIALRPVVVDAHAATVHRPVADHRQLANMPTTEFVALREAVHAADAHRSQRDGADRALAYAA